MGRKKKAKHQEAEPVAAVDQQPLLDESSDFVPFEEFIERIAFESVRSRIRHRALLQTLREGHFDWERYTENLEAVEDSDGDALFEILMLKWDVAVARHSEWMSRDFEKYGFRRKKARQQDPASPPAAVAGVPAERRDSSD